MIIMKKRKRRVKRKLKIGNIFLAISLIILISLVGIYISKGNPIQKEILKNTPLTPQKEKKSKKKVEEKEETYKVSMITAGDNLIHSSIYKDAYLGNNEYDFKPMYEYIKQLISNYDIKYYNQETILGGKELGVSDYPTFNSPQEAGDAMIDAGFNLVSLATNHTMDSREKAVLASREYWDKQTNVLAVGSYASEEERNKIHVLEKNNIKYTLLNYTYGTNGMPVPSGKEYLVNVWPTDIDNINNVEKDTKYQEYKNQVKKDVEAVRDKVDVLMVAMHWGVEYTHEPTEYEKDMAKYLESLGVDVIIGTHPHVIQPVTWINDTLVIYSLGNLISAQYQDANYNKMVGLMTSLDIEKTVKGKKSKIEIKNVNNELIYTYYRGWRNFKVVPFSNSEIKNYLPSYKQVYETYKSIVQKYNSDMPVVPLAEE